MVDRMEGREQERAEESEDSPRFDLKKKRSRHNNFRSSIFSTATRKRSVFFSRGFAATAARAPSFLAAMSGNRSGEEALAEGSNADPEAVRAAMAMDASSRGEVGVGCGSGGGGGGSGGIDGGDGGGGARDDEVAGLDEDGGNVGSRDGDADAASHYKGKHWSSAAAACVLGGHPPSPKAAAAVADAGSTAGGGGAGHNRRKCSGGDGGSGTGGDGGGVFSYSGAAAGTIGTIAGGITRNRNDGVNDGATAAHSGQGIAAAAAAPAEGEKNRPRQKSVWERGGAAPAPKMGWRQLIDPPRGGETTGARGSGGGTRSSRWNRGTAATAAGGEGGVQDGVTAGGGERSPPVRMEESPAVVQGRGGCLSCCRRSDGDGGSGGGSGGSEKGSACGRACCRRPLWCKAPSRSGGGGGGSGGGGVPLNRNQGRRRRLDPGRNGRNRPSVNTNSSGGGGSGSGIKASAIFLGIGLVLEVAATLWAFRQAAEAGALTGDVDGTLALAVAALAAGLGGQAVEAAVGVACLRNPSRSGTAALLAGTAIAEALGVVAVAAVLLLFLPRFPTAAAAAAWAAWATVASAIAGVVLEAIPAWFDGAARKLPFLGALGHALLWLGIAVLEVTVALLLVREAGTGSSSSSTAAAAAAAAAAEGQRKSLAGVLEGGEMVGLVAVEAAAMLAVWVARGLWTRARLLLAVKGQEGPSRRRSSHFTRFDSV